MADWTTFVLAFLAAVAAGSINALAGGGTLISFPALIALGLPALAANVTSTVALCPGYIGATWAQRKALAGKMKEMVVYIPVALIGGTAGGILLILSGEKLFGQCVPWLILFASLLLALQNPVRNRILHHGKEAGFKGKILGLPVILLFLAAIYGGYFGAGVSVIILAVLGVVSADSITKLNAMKQALAFSANISAGIYFVFTGKVNWSFALVMAAGALAGGTLGGMLAGRIAPALLRWTIIVIGITLSIIYFLK